jgi:GAF domain-containing protein
LIRQIADLIRERFDLYYVGLFLLDESSQWAVLRAATGEAGQAMLARGHRIQVGKGMIGWSVVHAQPRVALEAEADAVRLATAELPETRSEAALPLRSRDQVLGALSVQSTQPGAFDEETLVVLQTMADQVAVALDNAQLFAASQAALEAERHAYGELGRQAWTELLRLQADRGYRYLHGSTTPATGDWRPDMRQTVQTGQIAHGNSPQGATLSIPIKVRDQVVAVLGLRKDTVGEAWTTEEVTLLEALAEQLGVALDGARLYQDTQRRAAREQLASEIATHMRETLDIETVLRTAVDEIHQVLGLEELTIQLTPEAISSTDDAGRADGSSASQDNGSSTIGGSHA